MAPWGTRSDGQTGFLPKGSAVEQPPLPPVATVLASTDNSWDLEPRIGVVSDHDSGKSFDSPVEAWDAHVYFDGSSAESVEAALSLRHEVCLAFPDITVNRAQPQTDCRLDPLAAAAAAAAAAAVSAS